ncbi:MAG TPA: UrcA family protein [Sphingomonas sp.]|nr:UrcA family protein [Sphingomonas sp.]
MRHSTILSVAACILVPSVAVAGPFSETRLEHVSYAELNLSAPAGQMALEHRLERAARHVCRTADAWDLREQMSANACRKQALVDARFQMNQAIARARGRGSDAVLLAGR